MNIEQMIEKWDEQIALHRRVCDDPLMYNKEERLKNSHYAQAICAVLADLKQVKNLSSNTVLADRLPNAEDVKRWYQLLVGKSEIDMQKDLEATLR
jgi:hypothetical protein